MHSGGEGRYNNDKSKNIEPDWARNICVAVFVRSKSTIVRILRRTALKRFRCSGKKSDTNDVKTFANQNINYQHSEYKLCGEIHQDITLCSFEDVVDVIDDDVDAQRSQKHWFHQ